MKTLASLLLLGLGMNACSKQGSEALSRTFDIQQTQSATVSVAEDGKVQVAVPRISDSRCPTGAQCFWAGNAQATIKLSTPTDSTRTVHLCLGQCQADKPWQSRDSAAVTINRQAYWLHLTAITPYPSVANGNAAKTATLRLTRR